MPGRGREPLCGWLRFGTRRPPRIPLNWVRLLPSSQVNTFSKNCQKFLFGVIYIVLVPPLFPNVKDHLLFLLPKTKPRIHLYNQCHWNFQEWKVLSLSWWSNFRVHKTLLGSRPPPYQAPADFSGEAASGVQESALLSHSGECDSGAGQIMPSGILLYRLIPRKSDSPIRGWCGWLGQITGMGLQNKLQM